MPQLSSKKELFLERVNAWNPINIFAKISDVCRSSEFILLSFCFETGIMIGVLKNTVFRTTNWRNSFFFIEAVELQFNPKLNLSAGY